MDFKVLTAEKFVREICARFFSGILGEKCFDWLNQNCLSASANHVKEFKIALGQPDHSFFANSQGPCAKEKVCFAESKEVFDNFYENI